MTEEEWDTSWIPGRIFPDCENCKHRGLTYWEIKEDYKVGRGWCELKGERTYEYECCMEWEDRWGRGLRMRSWEDEWRGIPVKIFLGKPKEEDQEASE